MSLSSNQSLAAAAFGASGGTEKDAKKPVKKPPPAPGTAEHPDGLMGPPTGQQDAINNFDPLATANQTADQYQGAMSQAQGGLPFDPSALGSLLGK